MLDQPPMRESQNLPPLKATDVVAGREARVHRMPPSADRWRERSRFFAGIAAAMAAQWGDLDGLTPDQRDLFGMMA